MNVSLTNDLRDFVRQKVTSGEFPSEEAVLQEAVRRFRQEDQNGCRADDTEKATLEVMTEATARNPWRRGNTHAPSYHRGSHVCSRPNRLNSRLTQSSLPLGRLLFMLTRTRSSSLAVGGR